MAFVRALPRAKLRLISEAAMARRHHLPHLTLVQLAVDARFPADRLRMVDCLSRLASEDSTFHVSFHDEIGEVILSGMSETHVKAKADALKAEPLEITVGEPQVHYREYLIRSEVVDYTHKAQHGGAGQFARVTIMFDPGDDGTGVVLKQALIARGSLLEAHLAGIKKGLAAASENGVLAGFPLVDFEATLLGGTYHEMDSNELTFEIATRAACRELRHTGAVGLLEPMVRVTVTCPREHASAVIRDLEKRRAEEMKELSALVPLEAMLGYESDLKDLTEGRATFTLSYDHHREIEGDNGPWRFRPARAKRA
jgi:elongation factor G